MPEEKVKAYAIRIFFYFDFAIFSRKFISSKWHDVLTLAYTDAITVISR